MLVYVDMFTKHTDDRLCKCMDKSTKHTDVKLINRYIYKNVQMDSCVVVCMDIYKTYRWEAVLAYKKIYL